MIPGWVISILTFPGVIVHEAAHQLFCRLAGVAVLDVCYFRVGNPAGYVVHERAGRFSSSFLIAVGPFLVNSVLCVVFCFPAYVPLRVFDVKDPFLYVLMYLGISIGMHAFPSTQDAHGLWEEALPAARSLNPLAVLSLPVVGLIYLANIGSIFWLDCLYGLAIGFGVPELLFRRFG